MLSLDEALFECIGSVNDGASFWPDTTFVEVNTETIHSRAWEETPDSLMAASGLMHEHIHWTQSHASTFGIFTYLLRHRRVELLECYLRSLTPAARLDALRRWEGGQPLWRFGEALEGKLDTDPTSGRLARHWEALLVFDLIFRRGDLARAVQWDFGALFRIAYVHADGDFSLSEIFASEAPLFGSPVARRDDDLNLPVVERITCRSLEECAAYLNQREFYANADELWAERADSEALSGSLETIHDARWQSYLDDETGLYSGCIEYLCAEIEGIDINDGDVCAALLVMIDIALNPPLPPFVNLAPQFPEDGSINFSNGNLVQLHPPLRFVALVEAFRRVGLPKGGNALRLDEESYASYVTKLCKAAGLPHLIDYLYAVEQNDPTDGVYRTLDDSPLSYMKAHMLGHHRKACVIRRRKAASFASPSHAILYDSRFRQRLSRHRLTSVFLDPLQIVGGTGWFAGIEEKTYGQVLGSAGFARALASLMTGHASFQEAGLPQDDLHNGMVKRAQAFLVSRLRGG